MAPMRERRLDRGVHKTPAGLDNFPSPGPPDRQSETARFDTEDVPHAGARMAGDAKDAQRRGRDEAHVFRVFVEAVGLINRGRKQGGVFETHRHRIQLYA